MFCVIYKCRAIDDVEQASAQQLPGHPSPVSWPATRSDSDTHKDPGPLEHGAGRSGMPEVRCSAYTRVAWTHMQTLLQFDWQNGRRQWPRCCTPPTPPILHTYLEIRKVENAFDHPSPPDRHYAGCGRFAPPRPAILQEGLHVQYYRLHAYSPIFVDDCMLSTAQREL